MKNSIRRIIYYIKKIPLVIQKEFYGLYYYIFGKMAKLDNNAGYDRIYFYHMKKTAGTSINKMFLSLQYENYNEAYKKICCAPKLRVDNENFSYCGWGKSQVRWGKYNYAFSHYPFHSIKIPKNTYTFTVFRDPVKRVISLYSMYLGFYKNGRDSISKFDANIHPGKTLTEFIDNVDDKVIMGQLYFFS